MISFLNLIICNTKRNLKNKGTMAMTFLAPLLLIFGFGVFFNGMAIDDKKEYYFVNLETSQDGYGKELIKELEKNYKITLYSEDEALERLKKKRIGEFYVIPDTFTNDIKSLGKPEINVVRRESSSEFNDFGMELDNVVNKLIIREELQNNIGSNIDLDNLEYNNEAVTIKANDNTFVGQMTLAILLSFLLYSSIGISYELFYLKKQGTLRRSLATGNKTSTIIGAVLGAQFVMLFVGYAMIFILNVYTNVPYMKGDIPIILSNVVALTLVGLSLAVFINRLVKNEALIAVILQGIVGITCFIGGTFVPLSLLPEKLTIVSKFTPQYWAMESISSGRFEYIFIVLLFAIVLFTAGTVSKRSFAEI